MIPISALLARMKMGKWHFIFLINYYPTEIRLSGPVKTFQTLKCKTFQRKKIFSVNELTSFPAKKFVAHVAKMINVFTLHNYTIANTLTIIKTTKDFY